MYNFGGAISLKFLANNDHLQTLTKARTKPTRMIFYLLCPFFALGVFGSRDRRDATVMLVES